jgi:hypothetical protein
MGVFQSSAYSTNDYELVIKASKELEYFLEAEFHATGKGLHEKITSAQSELSSDIIKKMRYLATIRNKLIHERGFDAIPDRNKFIASFEASKVELEKIVKARNSNSSCIIS